MALSLYDVSAPVFRQYLAALGGVLEKAQAKVASGALDEAELIGFRLFEDMLPFSFQVAQAINHGAGAVANLRGETYPRVQGLETLEACKSAVDAAVAYLDGVTPADVIIDEDADVVLTNPRGSMTFTARNYLLTFAYGHFFFHDTTAYDILRHKGVEIGKRDFLGASQIKART
jgi:hypothetical protein